MEFNLQIAVWRLTGVLPAGPFGEVTIDDWSYIVLHFTPDQEFEVRQAALVMIESESTKPDEKLSVGKRKFVYDVEEHVAEGVGDRFAEEVIRQLEKVWLDKQRQKHNLKGKAPLFTAFLHAFVDFEKPDRNKMVQDAKYLMVHVVS